MVYALALSVALGGALGATYATTAAAAPPPPRAPPVAAAPPPECAPPAAPSLDIAVQPSQQGGLLCIQSPFAPLGKQLRVLLDRLEGPRALLEKIWRVLLRRPLV